MPNTNPNLTENPKKPIIRDDNVKNPDKTRDALKDTPDSAKQHGSDCGC